MFQKLSNQQKGSLLAFIGVFLITPDSLLIRLSNIETWGMLFYRGAIPFVVVLIGTLFFYKKNFLKAVFRVGYPGIFYTCLLYTSPSPRDRQKSRMPSSA